MKSRFAPIQHGHSIRIRIWPVLSLGFGALTLLVALCGWSAYVRSRATYDGMSALYGTEYEFQSSLGTVRSNIGQSAVLVRDFLLDPASAESSGREFANLKQSTEIQITKLRKLIPIRQTGKLDNVEQQLQIYWASLEPVLTRPTRAKSPAAYAFIQNEILPHRQTALSVISDIELLSRDAFDQRKADIDARNNDLASYFARSVAVALLIASCVAGVSVYRTYTLERTAEQQHAKVLAAEEELRRLSQQLVGAQEEERRALSRDLHDQVGQVVTALRMSLGNIEMAVDSSDPRVQRELELAKRLAGQALRTTRDLAMGLRPTMLDDLGLEAALEWYARQHSKIYGIPVALNVAAPLEQLSDSQKTCVYRIVQESLNNAAKHARANSVTILVTNNDRNIGLSIADDGLGFDPEKQTSIGLGLLGMRERISQVGGRIAIESKPNMGTKISVTFPAGAVQG